MTNLQQFKDVPNWHPPAQMDKLAELATGLDVVVEVGSWLGHSAIAMAQAVAGKVYCVDHWHGSPVGTGLVSDPLALYEAFLENVHRFGVGERIVPIMSPSLDASLLFLLYPIDLVYIDGDHGYQSVMEDLKHWAPLVRDGGLVCGDDYVEKGPRTAFNEFFKGQTIETACEGRLVMVRTLAPTGRSAM